MIKIEYGANEYIFEVNPTNMIVVRNIIIDREQQSDGTKISYERAKKWNFTLIFDYIPKTMFDVLTTIKNTQEPYQLTLSEIHPVGKYKVIWKNDMSMKYWSPFVNGGFMGEIEFQEV